MQPIPCCQATKASSSGQSYLRPIHKLATWLLPAAALALMPKCPACVAAYIALATGLTISLPTAAYLRISLIILCVAAMILLTGAALRYNRPWKGQSH